MFATQKVEEALVMGSQIRVIAPAEPVTAPQHVEDFQEQGRDSEGNDHRDRCSQLV